MYGAVAMAMGRLVDYFVEVVADAALPPHAADADEFDRRVAFRLPAVDHDDFPLPDGVPFFCIPSCLSAVSPSAYERKPTFFSFSLTGGDGSRAYGFALHFYDDLTNDKWRPCVFCIISHHPFFSLFKEVVSWVYRQRTHSSELQVVESILADASGQRQWFVSPRGAFAPVDNKPYRLPLVDASLPQRAVSETGVVAPGPEEPECLSYEDAVDRILTQLVFHAECPGPGGVLDLRIDGHPFFRYHVYRSNLVHVDDYCFQVLFHCLSLKNIVFIINCMLLEQRVLIHSNHHGLLTPVCEALCTLLYPFVWEHVYVPFLPVKLIEYLQAPVPYIMGLHTSSLATKIGADIFSSCVVVHLDKDKVVTPISSRVDDTPVDFVLARLPSQEVDKLLETVAHLVPQPIHTSPTAYSRRSSDNNSPIATLSGNPSRPFEHVVESLNFSNFPFSVENEVELTFGEGPLGITFESTHLRMLAVNQFQPGRQPGTSAVVKSLPRLHNGLPGPAERSGVIGAGSFLVAINGVTTLDLTFEETIDRLRVEKRPVRLRFLNAPAPHQNACRFAERLQSISLVSALQIDHRNPLLRWVDAVRGAFAVLFTSIFRDFQRFILIEHIGMTSPPSKSSSKRITSLSRSASTHAASRRRRSSALAFSVTFDHASFCEASCEAAESFMVGNSSAGFLREFTLTQSFSGFVNDSVIGRISHTTTYPQLELFLNCIHLYHEIGDPDRAAEAIRLLFERDQTAIESHQLQLPLRNDPDFNEQTLVTVAKPSSEPSRSPVGCPVQSTPPHLASSTVRATTTRQFEMIICRSMLDSTTSDASIVLDAELLKQPHDGVTTPKTCETTSPSTSSSSPRALETGEHTDSPPSLSSLVPDVQDDCIGCHLKPALDVDGKQREIGPEDSVETEFLHRSSRRDFP